MLQLPPRISIGGVTEQWGLTGCWSCFLASSLGQCIGTLLASAPLSEVTLAMWTSQDCQVRAHRDSLLLISRVAVKAKVPQQITDSPLCQMLYFLVYFPWLLAITEPKKYIEPFSALELVYQSHFFLSDPWILYSVLKQIKERKW